jgi:hypothetical protein
MAAAITVSDFEFIMSTILRQGNDSSLRKALLKADVLDLESLMCLNDREIGRLKFLDDSSGTIVLEDLSVGHQGLIRCFKGFARKKLADGDPIDSDWQLLTDLDEFREYRLHEYHGAVPYSDRIDEYDDTVPYSKQDNNMPSSDLSIAVPTPAVAPGGTASFPPMTQTRSCYVHYHEREQAARSWSHSCCDDSKRAFSPRLSSLA